MLGRLNPAKPLIYGNCGAVVFVDIKAKRTTGQAARNFKKTGTNAAKPPVCVDEQMRDVSGVRLQNEEADNAGLLFFRDQNSGCPEKISQSFGFVGFLRQTLWEEFEAIKKNALNFNRICAVMRPDDPARNRVSEHYHIGMVG